MTIITIALLALALILALLMSIVDWRERLIPDIYLFPFMLIGMLLVALGTLPWTTPVYSAIAGLFAYFLTFGINQLFKMRNQKIHNKKRIVHGLDAIGMGDIKLLGAGGIWLGVAGLPAAVIVACVIGYVWGVRNKERFVPFAPFFFVGALVSMAIMLW